MARGPMGMLAEWAVSSSKKYPDTLIALWVPSGEMKAQRRPRPHATGYTYVDTRATCIKKMSTMEKLIVFLFPGERMPALLEVPEYQFFYR